MTKKTINDVTFLEFELFKSLDWLRHCFSTRLGGVSEGAFSSMNFRTKGDLAENVFENYRRICEAASLNFGTLTISAQDHGTNIKEITQKDAGSGIHKERDYGSVDGLITSETGIAISTFHADCAAVFLVDVEHRAIGLVHAGWRGTVDKIVVAAVSEMAKNYGTKPENLIVGVGTSICASCFEVDEPVYELFHEFAEYRKTSEQKEGKYLIDLKSVNRKLLTGLGVRDENIEVSPLCTKCDDILFFSHRRDGDMRGSMAAFMEIKA